MDTDDERARAMVAKQIDWFDRDFRTRAEYQVYEAARGVAPQRSERTGEWFMLGYEDARDAFQRPELFRNSLQRVGEQMGRIPAYPVNTDDDVHMEYRRLLMPLFTARRMAVLEGAMRKYAQELLAPLAGRAAADLALDFTIPFPAGSFCRLMGFPAEDYAHLLRWKDAYLNANSPQIAASFGITDFRPDGRPTLAAAHELSLRTGVAVSAYLRPLIAQRRSDPRDDLLTELVRTRHTDGTPMTDDELVSISFNLFLGGLDTVSGTLSMVLRHFAANPADRDRFVERADDDERAARAVEELIRFQSIVAMPRRVAETTSFRGAELQAGDAVWLVTPAANRDPAQFANAASLDYDRWPNPHLGFGSGVHRCLGIHLARLEMRIALQELHRAIPGYRLDPGNPPVIGSGAQRGLLSLPVLLG
jgi:cytochrome P450